MYWHHQIWVLTLITLFSRSDPVCHQTIGKKKLWMAYNCYCFTPQNLCVPNKTFLHLYYTSLVRSRKRWVPNLLVLGCWVVLQSHVYEWDQNVPWWDPQEASIYLHTHTICIWIWMEPTALMSGLSRIPDGGGYCAMQVHRGRDQQPAGKGNPCWCWCLIHISLGRWQPCVYSSQEETEMFLL